MKIILYIGLVVILAILAIRRLHINEEVKRENALLDQKSQELAEKVAELDKTITSSETSVQSLEKRKQELSADIEQISAQAKAASDKIYEQSYALMQENLDRAAQESSVKYQKAREEAEAEYAVNLREQEQTLADLLNQIHDKEVQLGDIQAKIAAAIESSRKQQLQEDEKHFYTINISEDALWDIKQLHEATQQLKGDRLPIDKIIWEVYYKKPTIEMLSRVLPSKEKHCGIYKITELSTGKCYIGQSKDIRTRFLQHTKAGLGINSSNNKLYTEMKKIGPENFMYEVLEECPAEELDKREKYWIDFYQATDWGWNSTKGNGK